MTPIITNAVRATCGEGCSYPACPKWCSPFPVSSVAIAALIAEREARAFDEGQRTTDGALRMCVNCGQTVDAAMVKRGDELPGCADGGMAACTFDMTPSEACRHWSERWHELAASLPSVRAEAREAGRREGLEEASKAAHRYEHAPDGYVYTQPPDSPFFKGWSACAERMLHAIHQCIGRGMPHG